MSYVTTKVGRCVNFKNTDNIFKVCATIILFYDLIKGIKYDCTRC
jgi:hypothetical protein